MAHAIATLILLPFKIAALLLEILGRTFAVVLGLVFFGIGALLCCLPPLILIGAPLCLLSAVLVVKAL
jgi:hypothetical protein